MKIFAILALAALVASPAMAMEHGHSDGAAHGSYITTADADKNGMVSMAEAQSSTDKMFATEESFKTADKNADGSLSADEVMAPTEPAAH